MKKIIFIVSMFMLPINKGVAQNQVKVFINIDKSLSMPSNSVKQDKYLTKLVKEHTKDKKIVVFEIRFINSNTSSASNSKIIIYKEPVYKSSEDDELQRVLHLNKIKRKRNTVAKHIIKFINLYKAEAKFTNIISSLIPISKLKSRDVFVYYLTDGVESSREFRMLDLYPFKTAKKAIELARKDVKKLHALYSLPEKLKEIKKVQFILPMQMDKKVKGSAFIEVYFREVFKSFGVMNVQFQTL